MAQPRRRAEFFVSPDGVITPKAPPLKRSVALRIYKRDGGVCGICRRKVRFGGRYTTPFDKEAAGAIDHILPRSRGGSNEESNLRLLCQSCNASKGAK